MANLHRIIELNWFCTLHEICSKALQEERQGTKEENPNAMAVVLQESHFQAKIPEANYNPVFLRRKEHCHGRTQRL